MQELSSGLFPFTEPQSEQDFKMFDKKPIRKNIFNIMAVLMTAAFMLFVITPGAPTEEEIAAQDRWVEERMPGKGVDQCGGGDAWDRLPEHEIIWRESFRGDLVNLYWDDVPAAYVKATAGEKFSPDSGSSECLRRADLAMERIYIKERTPPLGVCDGGYPYVGFGSNEKWSAELRAKLVAEYAGVEKPYIPIKGREAQLAVVIYADENSDTCKGVK